jgi:hypothetical protein
MAECPKCGAEFEAEGKIARCPDCRATFKNNGDARKKKAKVKAKAAPPPPPKKPAPAKPQAADADMYGFDQNEEDLAEIRRVREEEEEQKNEEKKKIAKPTITIKRKNIGDLDVWAYINSSMMWFLFGTIAWGLAHLLQGIIIILGAVQGPEYAGPVVRFLIAPNQPAFELGQGDVLDRASFVMAMLGGSDLIMVTFSLLLVIEVLSWIQTGLWMTGYAIAWRGSELVEYSRGQLTTLFTIGGINFLLRFFFFFLPAVGAYSYVLMPLWGTELTMADANMDRSTPLHVFWSFAPFWEEILALVILVCRYLEPALIAYFVWTVGTTLKDEPLEKSAVGTVRTGFAIMFLLLTFHLFALTGNSPVLVKVLRVLYGLWYGFMILWILKMVGIFNKCRDVFRFYFHPDED